MLDHGLNTDERPRSLIYRRPVMTGFSHFATAQTGARGDSR